MAAQNTNPFYGSSNGGMSASGDQRRLALDNLIRRELKVGDPNDPKQIAAALLNRFKDDPRANAITQEAKGLPFLLSSSSTPMMKQVSTSSDAELQQAKDDVERDLQELLTNSLLKDVTPEIQGWAQAIRSAIAEGTTAARFALDTRQRDKAFSIRRQLGDYARIARLVGILTPTMNMTYRKFAQSLDEVSAVLMVLMGESLSNVGFNGGRFLLQAPYSELQTRRDAVIYALRNLVGATQEAISSNDWPRGLDAYRSLYDKLENQGQGDLRFLLVENELARCMDELIQRAAHGTADGLRALGSTAQLDLERFRRLVIIGNTAVVPASPSLTGFLEAMQLFVDAFNGSGGFRLLRIARPPILFYGLYGMEISNSDQRLINLVIQRGLLADRLDCYAGCACNDDTVATNAIKLDKILYDVDRAIDLYALGLNEFGYPESRAAAYAYLIEAANITGLGEVENILGKIKFNLLGPELPSKLVKDFGTAPAPIIKWEDRIKDFANYGLSFKKSLTDPKIGAKELYAAIKKSLEKFVITTNAAGDDVFSSLIAPPFNDDNNHLMRLALTYSLIQKAITLLHSKSEIPPSYQGINTDIINIMSSYTELSNVVKQELCLQAATESNWGNLVKTMAPDCLGIDGKLRSIQGLIKSAIDDLGGDNRCDSFEPSIPPHFEYSLGRINKFIK